MIETNEIVKNKFWVIKENNKLIATVSTDNDKLFYNGAKERLFFDTALQLKSALNIDLTAAEPSINDGQVFLIEGFPTSATPGQVLYDIKNKLHLYTKTETSSCMYAAGYFLVKFDKRWSKIFCPKITTLEKYEYKGPFKTLEEVSENL